MKNLIKDLQGFEKAASGTGGSSSFLKLSPDESARVRFLQELDQNAKNFDEGHGIALGVFEHANPESGNPRFECTMEDEGHCYGCELGAKNPRWKKRARLYINAILRGTGGAEDKVVIVNQGLSSRSIGGALVEYAKELGTICDRDYRIKRIGEGLKTNYNLIPMDTSVLKKEEKTLPLVDAGQFIKSLSYDEQIDAVKNAGQPKSGGDEW